tara:strand:- start:337 stop:660 length:324 start_codon:yes stop_codon:yes gene_type:complete
MAASLLELVSNLFLVGAQAAALGALELDKDRAADPAVSLVAWHKDLEIRPAEPGAQALELLLESDVPGALVWGMMKYTARWESELQPIDNLSLQLVLSHGPCRSHLA